MKTNEVRPETFIQGLGSSDEVTYGLTFLGATDEDILAGLSGLGAPATRQTGTMTAIVQSAKELNAKRAAVAKARSQMAQKNPAAALKLQSEMKRTAAPGTSVARAVVETMNKAAKVAVQAKQDEKKAVTLLQQSDKRGAAAVAVNALQKAREAATLANKAEKTRLTTALDSVAKTLESQADYIEGIVRNETARGGQSARSNVLMAQAQQLRTQARNMRNQSAVVQAAPDVPPNAPSAERIAEVANKFNIRTAGRAKFDRRRAVVSVLGDLADDPLAQVKDYEGAVNYYGMDAVGRLAADIEFDNHDKAISGLSRAVNGIGQVEPIPSFEAAQRALDAGVVAARTGYVNAVIPAWTGSGAASHMMRAKVGGLMGLSALGGAYDDRAQWPAWCQRYVTSRETPSGAAYNGDVSKCANPKGKPPSLLNFFVFPPWTQAGLVERGVKDIGAAIATVASDIISGRERIELPQLPGAGGGGGGAGGGAQPQNPAPPPSAKPPAVVEGGTFDRFRQGLLDKGGSIVPQVQQTYGTFTQTASKFNPMYIAAGVGGVALLGVGFMLFRRR